MTKHEQILSYNNILPIGEKISVRGIAKVNSVSEGTAYHAIKVAENKGMVATINRVGTIRIERKLKEKNVQVTFAEVTKMVDGQVVGGQSGLHKSLGKFLIGAMEIDEMMGYITRGDLLIVGNRVNVQERALEAGAAVLITGGFSVQKQIKQLADRLSLPILVTQYDTFTVAKKINRFIDDQRMKNILLVEDILESVSEGNFLQMTDTIAKWHDLNIRTKHTRFPVVDEAMKVQGVVTSSNVLGVPFEKKIDNVMTEKAITVTRNMSLLAAAHLMAGHRIQVVPIVDSEHRLVGVLRQNMVDQALQINNRQDIAADTLEAYMSHQLITETDGTYTIEVTSQISNFNGSISYSAFMTILTEVTDRVFQKLKYANFVIENISIYYLENIPIHSQLVIIPEVLTSGVRSGKLDIKVKVAGQAVAKALLSCQLLKA